MARSLSSLLALLCVIIVVVGCADGPVGPTDDAVLPAPQFLIGGSPLITLTIIDDDTRKLSVDLEVTKGIVQAADNDKFWLRATPTFEIDNEDPVGLQPCVDKPTPDKQEQIRGSSTVAVIMDIDIPDDPWAKLVAAAGLGAEITAHVTVELLLIDGAGKEHVLETVAAASVITPGDGG